MNSKYYFIGQAMEDISAGDAVVMDAFTGKLRKANKDDNLNIVLPLNSSIPHVWKDDDFK